MCRAGDAAMSCCAAGSLPSPWWKRARPRGGDGEPATASEPPLGGRSLRLVADRPALGERSLGWLRYLHRKVSLVDDWSRGGHPSELWDDVTSPPTFSWHRFDLIQSSYALALMCDVTPAWREVYEQLLDGLLRRYITYWGCIDWMETLGDDPNRDKYPESWYRFLIPEQLRGRYNAPGWCGNGLEPWGLEWDPIGAQGNLFYKGWLDLMLGLHAYVSGSQKWNEPFVVVGESDRSFTYTHRAINDVLSAQWGSRPEGCHCENTKIWPTCLSAAGLGLGLHDQLYGTDSHWAFDQWWEHAERRYLRFDDDGRPTSAALYYDPLIDHVQEGGPAGALPLALYLAPQRPQVAELVFRWAVRSFGWDDPERELWTGPKDPWLITTAIVLARELGDDAVYARLRAHAEAAFEPTWNKAGEFHYGFGLGERIPRGQPNATLLVADAGRAGSWSRVFTEPNQSKLTQPTVTGVDYPRLGIAQAHYDPPDRSLAIATYAATPEAAGQSTTITIEQLRAAEQCRVTRDDRAYDRVKVVAPDRIEISIRIGEHAFLISEQR
jgi:Linalool dehydratase/isomerase